MSEAHLDAVLAGSRGFALALFVPLTEQVGIRPRVATDAKQALALVDSERGLVVVEVEGEGTVRSIRELLATRRDLAVVAAVPDAMAAEGDALRALGVELAPWDGSPGSVLGAVSRRLGAARPEAAAEAAPSPAPGGAPAAAAPPATPVAAAPAGPYFGDLGTGDDLDVVSIEDLGPDGSAPAPASPGGPVAGVASVHAPPPPPSGAGAWPSGGLTFAEAEKALARGLGSGFVGDSKLRTVTEGVVNTLTALEFAVAAGDPVAVRPEPIRRAALMRIRVAAALADRPPIGSVVDQGALSEMLGEIDALLSEVNALTQGAPPDVLPSLEAVRNALVKEAIDFSEAAQEIAPAERAPAPGPGAAPAARRAPAARLLTVSSAPEVRSASTRNLSVGLVLAVLVAGGYHGYRYWVRVHRPVPAPLLANAPARAMGAATTQGAKLLTSKDGKPFTDAEIETFRQREELAGRRVELLNPTTMISLPPGAPAPVPQRAAPAPAPSAVGSPARPPQPIQPKSGPGAAP